MSTTRVRATIAPIDEDNEQIDDTIVFEYGYPMVNTSSNSRTVKHEPIGTEPVIDHMGPSAQQITFKGHCYRDEANRIDNLTDTGRVRIMTDRWRGIAIVDQAETDTSGSGGGKRSGEHNRLHEYRIVVWEVQGRAPTG